MTTTPTQNPVPSEAVVDLKFNAGKIDEFVTSFLLKYTDRFGQEHLTIEGIRDIVERAIKAFGFITMDSFEDGATLDNSSQALRWKQSGEHYRWDGGFPKVVPENSTPENSGGIGFGAWLNMGDLSLRSDLKSYGIGLSNQQTIQNFDWQYFEFTSGANYLMYQGNSLNNPPTLVIPPTAPGVSVTVDYITYSKVTGLTLIVIGGSPIVYKMLVTGEPGSRVFYVVQEWNSGGSVPILGGGTGATTASQAITNLGALPVTGGQLTGALEVTGKVTPSDYANFDARYSPINYIPPLSRVWLSSELLPVSNTPTIVTHGLAGIDPLKCRCDVLLKCVIANNGYSPGDFAINWVMNTNSSESVVRLAATPALNTTTIQINTGGYSSGVGVAMSHKSNAAYIAPPLANWRYIFRIFY